MPVLFRRLQLMVVILVIGANAGVLSLAWVTLQNSREQHIERAETLTRNIASALDQGISASVGKLEIALDGIVNELEYELGKASFNADRLNRYMAQQKERLPELEAIRASDASGRVFLGLGVDPANLQSWADRGYFRFHRDTDLRDSLVNKPLLGRVTQQYIVAITRRYNHPDGRFAGVVAANLTVEYLGGMLAQYDLGRQGSIILRDADLGLIARVPAIPDRPAGQIGHRGVSPEFLALYNEGLREGTYGTPAGADGLARLATFRRLDPVPMLVVAAVSTDEVLAEWRSERDKTVALVLAFTAITLLTAFLLWRLLARTHEGLEARRQADEQHRQLAYFDALTGLPNRRLLLDRLSHALASARRSGQTGALLFVDLDNFKQVNDARGHAVGDALLVQMSRRISEQLRTEDTVARLGGDEFVVLVSDLGQGHDAALRAALAVAEKLRACLDMPCVIEDGAYTVTGSIGITLFPAHADREDDLLRQADIAMYRAKEAGRNRYAFFEPSMQAEVEQRLALEQDLKLALETGALQVHVQGQFDQQGHCVGGELLLRWNHPERGVISPAVFIPVAEASGLILPMGDWVLRQAGALLARLDRAGLGHLSLSVNMSPRQFVQEDLVTRVQAILDDTGAQPSRLVLELTENLLVSDVDAVIARMDALTKLGLHFSIDDFGTGYSSLAYLKRLPLDEVKIDRSFVRDVTEDPNDAAIVQAMLSIAAHLQLRVVAEGVETEAQREFLRRAGCDRYQGYLLARPQPVADWLQSLGVSS